MRRVMFLLLIILRAGTADALSVEIYPANYQARFERNEEHTLAAMNALNFAAGLSTEIWGGLVEYSFFDGVSGTRYSNMTRRHQELILWGRREFPLSPSWRWSGAAGLGLSREDIGSRFAEEEKINDVGGNEALAAVSAGLTFEMKKTLRLSLEGRLFFGANMDPSPQPDVVVRSGFRF